ncbi:MAG: hypothetical protein Q8K92_08395 [Leadbetterella sp.]|nr:hypothetical protein [Leadbetterella sp.]
MKNKVDVDREDAREIAGLILNREELSEDDDNAIEDGLIEKWNIDLDTFREIMHSAIQHIDFGLSPLTQTAYVGISRPGIWIVKKEVDQQFLAGIIEWATEGEEIKEGSNGYLREITKDGKVEYEIVIRRPGSRPERRPLPSN